MVPAIYVSAGTGRASRRDRQFVADVFGGHEEGCGEGVGLVLDFFDAPDLVAVDDEVPELVSDVEPGSCPVVLVGAEHDDGPVMEGQREGVDVGGVQREADEQDAVLFEDLGDVRYWAAGHAERLPHLPGCFLEFPVGEPAGR